MTICTATPEVDARLTHPPNLHDIARYWAGAMDTTVLLPFNLWFQWVFATAKSPTPQEPV